MTPPRFPRELYEAGSEPDVRFSLANERTFLSWIRTGLALIAAGVALESFALQLQPQLRFAASLVLIAGGIAAPIQAWSGWLKTETALRADRPLPSARLALPLAILVSVVGALIIFAIVLS